MRLALDAVEGWMAEMATGVPPPDLDVSLRSEFGLLDQAMPGINAVIGAEERDPGCYLFFLEPGADVALTPRFLSQISERISTNAVEFRRQLSIQWNLDDDDGIFDSGDESPLPDETPRLEPSAPRSAIVLQDGRQIDSIGPGGRIWIQRRNRLITGSAALRPFTESRSSPSWATVGTVLDELAPFTGQGLQVDADFGYYEHSWVNRQRAIHPTFTFLLTNGPDARFTFKHLVTVPATVSGPDGRDRFED